MRNKPVAAAHIAEDKSIHVLEDHLREVGAMAGAFAAGFRAQDWAELAGRWHDLGKYSSTFQKMIYEANGMEAHIEPDTLGPRNHSSAGALHAVAKLGLRGRIVAYLIAGHHAGLPDWHKLDAPGQALNERLADKSLLHDALKADVPNDILTGDLPALPGFGGSAGFALWVRMLFSALVDADFLDTEAFYDQKQALRRGGYAALADLKEDFDDYMLAKIAEAEPTDVNRVRAEILADCRRGALQAPGMFSLTVPTGGGKTLSSMAFALEHALAHSKRRIIYAIPYTSIIEQTANIFRDIFGDHVIEHHSSLDPEKEDRRSRLAAENWDAPIIVTTNVQFFESLFAARTSRCRKLHNIADSIVVLDEAQLLPPEFLQPIMTVMRLLASHYGVTFVLSTATQPALKTHKDPFGKPRFHGLDDMREIVPDPDALYRRLERVEVELASDLQQPRTWDDIAEELKAYESVLVVVNSRKDARDLFKLMPEGSIHLSALMCGKHRSRVIETIKQRLRLQPGQRTVAGLPTRVVSTQLVEAGVDLDFPVVYRALAGLDSIAQAAGRCNREGRLPGKGKVVVFVPPHDPPPGVLRMAKQKTVSLLSGYVGDPLARENFTHFFEMFYGETDIDKQGIERLLAVEGDLSGVQFRTAAMKMRLISDAGRTIFVRYDETGEVLLDQLSAFGPNRDLMRKLQRYTVNVPEYWFRKLEDSGDVAPIYEDLYAQTSGALYHEDLGLLLEGDTIAVDRLIVGDL